MKSKSDYIVFIWEFFVIPCNHENVWYYEMKFLIYENIPYQNSNNFMIFWDHNPGIETETLISSLNYRYFAKLSFYLTWCSFWLSSLISIKFSSSPTLLGPFISNLVSFIFIGPLFLLCSPSLKVSFTALGLQLLI